MNLNLEQFITDFSRKGNIKLLASSKHGLERECLRIDHRGNISKKPHPTKLYGSALTNPYITTDFSDAQTEIVTPPLKSERSAYNYLKNLQTFIHQRNLKELSWPYSMPCRLPQNEENIPVATYGNSNSGKRKTVYRIGLGHRYGRRMQTISGIHYNFSFSKKFWTQLHKLSKSENSQKSFKTSSYFKMMRNFLRVCWLDSYLFGASPAVDKSYLPKKIPIFIEKLDKETYYAPYATTLRMSKIGYCCRNQTDLKISFNSLCSYLKDLNKAIATSSKEYAKIGVFKNGKQIQLNDHILQLPNEYYAAVRPKQRPKYGEKMLQTLSTGGVRYLEIRSPDLDPFDPVGISKEHLYFYNCLMIYCLTQSSRPLTEQDHKTIIDNHNKVAITGRKPGLKLNKNSKSISLHNWAQELLHDLQKIAVLLDKANGTSAYTKSIEAQRKKIHDPSLLPSAQIIESLKQNKKSFLKHGLTLSNFHKDYYLDQKLDQDTQNRFLLAAQKSLHDKKLLEIQSEFTLEGYEDLEHSTQMLIREALNRNVKVDIIDRKQNFICLTKGKKVEYIRQATMTSLDTLISYFIMENKFVTKHILSQHNISVPEGELYRSYQTALESYDQFKHKKIVVKPLDTNYGIAVNFIKPNKKAQYISALKKAYKHSDSVIVEEYIEGEEFRLLVINDKVEAVLKRIPANVTGDGIHTISQLIDQKNSDPLMYKVPKEALRKGKTEKAKLATQNLTMSSIPKKEELIFLRDNSNVSNGGDPIDYTDKIPAAYKRIAISSAKAINAKICGVDMVIKNFKKEPSMLIFL